jgi:hypothetical protein
MQVEDLRAEVEITPELERLRDHVGASADGITSKARASQS